MIDFRLNPTVLERRIYCNEWIIAATFLVLPPLFPAIIFGFRQRTWAYLRWSLCTAIAIVCLYYIGEFAGFSEHAPSVLGRLVRIKDLGNQWVQGIIFFFVIALNTQYFKNESRTRR